MDRKQDGSKNLLSEVTILIENNKIIIVPSYWRYKIIEGKKVIIDQLGNVIGIVVEEK